MKHAHGSPDMSPEAEPWAHSALFRSLDAEAGAALIALAHVQSYGAGEMLFHENDVAEGFHVLTLGRVKIFHLRADGRESVLHVIRPGRLTGEAAFARGRHPFGAAALEKTRSLYIPMISFQRFALDHPALLLDLSSALALRLRMFARKLQARDNGDAVRRVALYLLHRRRLAADGAVDLDVSREVLAAMLGLARETLSRSLARLTAEGLIRLEGRRVLFPEPHRLEAVARSKEAYGV